MGWRFRRTLSMGGFRWTYFERGIGGSWGLGGILRFGVSPDGRRYVSIRIPGTGISWLSRILGTRRLRWRGDRRRWRCRSTCDARRSDYSSVEFHPGDACPWNADRNVAPSIRRYAEPKNAPKSPASSYSSLGDGPAESAHAKSATKPPTHETPSLSLDECSSQIIRERYS